VICDVDTQRHRRWHRWWELSNLTAAAHRDTEAPLVNCASCGAVLDDDNADDADTHQCAPA
jgi:hypothetical protein